MTKTFFDPNNPPPHPKKTPIAATTKIPTIERAKEERREESVAEIQRLLAVVTMSFVRFLEGFTAGV